MKRLNRKQKDALSKLADAFAVCAEVGLCFIGMDGQLEAYDHQTLLRDEKRLNSLYDAQCNQGQGTTVETHKTYVDSGGW